MNIRFGQGALPTWAGFGRKVKVLTFQIKQAKSVVDFNLTKLQNTYIQDSSCVCTTKLVVIWRHVGSGHFFP